MIIVPGDPVPANSFEVSSVDINQGPQGLLPGASFSETVVVPALGSGAFDGTVSVTAVAKALPLDGTNNASTTIAVTDQSLTTVPGDSENPGPSYQLNFTVKNVGENPIQEFTVWITTTKAVPKSSGH